MTTIGIGMVRDEADIVAETVGHMLGQVDHVIVADNGSTDGTRDILTALAAGSGRLLVQDDPELGYFQSRKMSALAAQAAGMGAEWVVPFDADELWLAHAGRIADVLAEQETAVVTAQVVNHVAALGDDMDVPPVQRIGWRQRQALNLPKVACRARLPATIAAGNHSAHYASGVTHGLLEVRHFPYRSPEQFVRKARNGAAAYAATDLPRTTGQHWREYGELIDAEGDEAGEAWFRRHFWSADPEHDPELIFDPALCRLTSLSLS